MKGTDYALTYLPLGKPDDWKIVCFSDASWGNLPEGGSQGGHLIFISNCEGVANLISWQSHRMKRVARSTLAAETLAAVDACDSALLLSSQIAEIMNIKPLPRNITDNEPLVNASRSTTSVQEKRLRVDISVLREMIDRREIEPLSWVSTEYQLADCLTKQGAKVDNLIAAIKQETRLDPIRLKFMPAWHV